MTLITKWLMLREYLDMSHFHPLIPPPSCRILEVNAFRAATTQGTEKILTQHTVGGFQVLTPEGVPHKPTGIKVTTVGLFI